MFTLILPTYNESESLPQLLDEICQHWSKENGIIIADDSDEIHRDSIAKTVNKFRELGFQIDILYGNIRGGRGAAVQRAMKFSFNYLKRDDFLIEADADGSHRVQDILRMTEENLEAHFLVGSRYLFSSQIVGWSTSRRILSRMLNFIIPRVLGIRIRDITNGLRRYSYKSVEILLREPSINSGFIYLSEQALILKENDVTPREFPIEFVPRISGSSSVQVTDLYKSFYGLFRILAMKKRYERAH